MPSLRRRPRHLLASTRINALIGAVLVVAAIGFGTTAAADAGVDVSSYPVAATTWLDRHGYLVAPHRVAHQDIVGCYLELRFGPRVQVFIDDRVDMFPVLVSRDYATLLAGVPVPSRSWTGNNRCGGVGVQVAPRIPPGPFGQVAQDAWFPRLDGVRPLVDRIWEWPHLRTESDHSRAIPRTPF